MSANAQEAERGSAVSRWLESRLEGQPVVPGATFQAPLHNASTNDSVGASANYLSGNAEVRAINSSVFSPCASGQRYDSWSPDASLYRTVIQT